jgi:hypothetical protein
VGKVHSRWHFLASFQLAFVSFDLSNQFLIDMYSPNFYSLHLNPPKRMVRPNKKGNVTDDITNTIQHINISWGCLSHVVSITV